MSLTDKILRLAEYQLDDYTSEWAKGVENEHARLMPLIKELAECAEALESVRPLTDLADVSDALARLEKMLK